MARTLQVNIN